MSTALYAGSFDPPTNGHMYVIDTARKAFNGVVIAVATNADKRGTFSVSERIDMLKRSCAAFDNVKVISIESEFTVLVAQRMGIEFLIRGVRSAADLEYEKTLSHVNLNLAPNVQSVFFMPPPKIEDISSSLIRGLMGPPGWRSLVEAMVPTPVYEKLLDMHTRKRWIKTRVDSTFDNCIVRRYSEPHRGYHTMNHILHCLEVLDECKPAFSNIFYSDVWNQIEEAIWYHDVVYDPRADAGENERESALLFENSSRMGLNDKRATKELILATAKHFDYAFNPSNPVMQVLLDIDLSSFAATPEEQVKLSAGIRKEYSFVPIAAYKKGRTDLLKSLLEKPSIYRTDYFRGKYEKLARENIAREIDELNA